MILKDKLHAMGGRNGVKKALLTAFISTGSSNTMNKHQIAREARVDRNDKEMLKHIEVMMKRHDMRRK